MFKLRSDVDSEVRYRISDETSDLSLGVEFQIVMSDCRSCVRI